MRGGKIYLQRDLRNYRLAKARTIFSKNMM